MGQIFSDEAPKKRDKCIQCIIQGRAMQPLYTSVTMKKLSPSLSETTVTSVDNVF